MFTDSGLIFADGELLTKIWNTTVISEPPDLPPPIIPAFELLLHEAASVSSCRPSGDIVNPDGSNGIYVGSSPLIAMLMAGISTGLYTTNAPDESMQLSWRISMLFWLVL